jgi:hypothetical protein
LLPLHLWIIVIKAFGSVLASILYSPFNDAFLK